MYLINNCKYLDLRCALRTVTLAKHCLSTMASNPKHFKRDGKYIGVNGGSQRLLTKQHMLYFNTHCSLSSSDKSEELDDVDVKVTHFNMEGDLEEHEAARKIWDTDYQRLSHVCISFDKCSLKVFVYHCAFMFILQRQRCPCHHCCARLTSAV